MTSNIAPCVSRQAEAPRHDHRDAMQAAILNTTMICIQHGSRSPPPAQPGAIHSVGVFPLVSPRAALPIGYAGRSMWGNSARDSAQMRVGLALTGFRGACRHTVARESFGAWGVDASPKRW